MHLRDRPRLGGTARVKLTLRNPPLQAPFVGPLFLSMHGPGIDRRTIASDCKPNAAGGIKCRG